MHGTEPKEEWVWCNWCCLIGGSKLHHHNCVQAGYVVQLWRYSARLSCYNMIVSVVLFPRLFHHHHHQMILSMPSKKKKEKSTKLTGTYLFWRNSKRLVRSTLTWAAALSHLETLGSFWVEPLFWAEMKQSLEMIGWQPGVFRWKEKCKMSLTLGQSDADAGGQWRDAGCGKTCDNNL